MNYNRVTLAVMLLLASNAALAAADVTAVDAEAIAAAANKAAEQAAAYADKAAAEANGIMLAAENETSDANTKALEAQLQAARARLEQAAHEVADLSARMSGPLVEQFMTLGGEGFSRGIIGAQLDPASGPDGARIDEVSPGGPAADAGLRAGDVIVSVNGTDVKGNDTARQVYHLMHAVTPDSKVKVRVMREGKAREFVVTTRPGLSFHDFHMPPMPPDGDFQLPEVMMFHKPLAQMELVTLTPQLGRYFGSDKGVLVVRAPKDSGFKLQDGDVILAIDGREPTSGSHATRILGSYQPGEKISLRLMRDHKVITVETTLPEREGPERRVRMIHEEAPA
ncbi:MAG TPA: PDZ domain-containing protein [Steroidobacteraceae bacterium]|nr:PDZ domain-containing protein [Steroidobacteraceae bacterium]